MQPRSVLVAGIAFTLILVLVKPCGSSVVHEHAEKFQAALQDVVSTVVRNRRAVINADGKTSFSQEEQKLIVDVHNAYRSTVTPAATDMIELVWDDAIANFAQAHLDKCTGKHNPNTTLGPWTNMAENLFYMPGNKYTDVKPMEMWWDEGKEYHITQNTCTHQATCLHFIAMAWAKHEKMGCGIKKCDALTENMNLTPPQVLVLCNYSKMVLLNARPYTAGTSCRDCPAAYPKCRHRLCISDSMESSGAGFDGNTTIIGVTPGAGGGGGDDDDGSVSISASIAVIFTFTVLSLLLKM